MDSETCLALLAGCVGLVDSGPFADVCSDRSGASALLEEDVEVILLLDMRVCFLGEVFFFLCALHQGKHGRPFSG